MELIQSSKDVLNIALAFGVLIISISLTWFLVYLVMITKQFYEIIKNVKDAVKKVDEVMNSLREKIEHSASYLLLIGEGIRKLVGVARSFKGKNDSENDENEDGEKLKKRKK